MCRAGGFRLIRASTTHAGVRRLPGGACIAPPRGLATPGTTMADRVPLRASQPLARPLEKEAGGRDEEGGRRERGRDGSALPFDCFSASFSANLMSLGFPGKRSRFFSETRTSRRPHTAANPAPSMRAPSPLRPPPPPFPPKSDLRVRAEFFSYKGPACAASLKRPRPPPAVPSGPDSTRRPRPPSSPSALLGRSPHAPPPPRLPRRRRRRGPAAPARPPSAARSTRAAAGTRAAPLRRTEARGG